MSRDFMRIIEISPTGKQTETGQRVGDEDILVEGPDVIRTCIRMEHAQLLTEAPVRKTPCAAWQ